VAADIKKVKAEIETQTEAFDTAQGFLAQAMEEKKKADKTRAAAEAIEKAKNELVQL